MTVLLYMYESESVMLQKHCLKSSAKCTTNQMFSLITLLEKCSEKLGIWLRSMWLERDPGADCSLWGRWIAAHFDVKESSV